MSSRQAAPVAVQPSPALEEVVLDLTVEAPHDRPSTRTTPVATRRRRLAIGRSLVISDAVVVLGAILLTMALRFGLRWPDTYSPYRYGSGFLLATALHVGIFYFGGLYDRELRLGNRPRVPRIVWLTAVALLVVGFVQLFTAQFVIPRGNFVPLFLLTVALVALNRREARRRLVRVEGPPRVLLLGAAGDCERARPHLDRHTQPVQVVGQCASAHDLAGKVASAGATDVLILSSALLEGAPLPDLALLEEHRIGVLQRIGAKDTLLGLRSVREIGGMPFVALRAHALPSSQARLKRCMELLGIIVAAPLLLLVLGAIAAYVLLRVGRPLLFWQERIGRDGRIFRMVKFRTMGAGAEPSGPQLADRRDHRVIAGCHWLRCTRLDELPQLWNVLRGEMAVVGPRPERPTLVAAYERDIPGYAIRHQLAPGITGLAQTFGRYHSDPADKLGHDLQYAVNWSPVLDLQIVWRTVWVVFTRRV